MREWRIGRVGLPLALLAACSSEMTAPTFSPLTAAESAVQAQYNLVTANGATVPAGAGTYQINGTTCSRFVDGGFLLLGAQRNYTVSIAYRVICPSGVGTTSTTSNTQVTNGSWSYDGSRLVLTREGGSVIGITNLVLFGVNISADVQLETIPADAPFKYPLLTMRFQR